MMFALGFRSWMLPKWHGGGGRCSKEWTHKLYLFYRVDYKLCMRIHICDPFPGVSPGWSPKWAFSGGSGGGTAQEMNSKGRIFRAVITSSKKGKCVVVLARPLAWRWHTFMDVPIRLERMSFLGCGRGRGDDYYALHTHTNINQQQQRNSN